MREKGRGKEKKKEDGIKGREKERDKMNRGRERERESRKGIKFIMYKKR